MKPLYAVLNRMNLLCIVIYMMILEECWKRLELIVNAFTENKERKWNNIKGTSKLLIYIPSGLDFMIIYCDNICIKGKDKKGALSTTY